MKKVLATAAGLMLAGTMATSAMAEVSFSGDAYARFYTQDNFDLNSDAEDKNSKVISRVRLAFEGSSENAYAKARIKVGQGTWDGGNETTSITTDYAYIGVKLGEVTVNAGRQMANFGHKFWSWNIRKDRLSAVWKQGDTVLVGFYDKEDEYKDSVDAELDDKDTNRYGGVWKQKFGAWETQLVALYRDDELADDNDGLTGSVAFTGPAGPMTLVGEFSYKEADYQGTEDDGIGGFVGAVIKSGAMTIILPAAFTQDGYVTDGDFHPTYLFGVEENPMAALNYGTGGDTWAVAPSVDFAVSPKMTLHGAVAYADIDGFMSIIELDAGLAYQVGANSQVLVRAAHGIPDGANDADLDALSSFMVELNTAF